jgi:hypothetical protein
MRLGSIRNGQLNYQRDQHYFDLSDQKPMIKSIVSQVKHEIDRDILGLKKPRWDASVGVVGHKAVESLPMTLKNIRTGL